MKTTTAASSVRVAFFDPISWSFDKISGHVKEEVAEMITSILGFLVTWVLNGVAWIMAFVAEIVTSDALRPPNLSAGWFAGGVYSVMSELGLFGAAVAFIVAVTAGVISTNWQLLFKRSLLASLKWGFFTGLFLEGAGLAQQAMAAAEDAVGGSGLGSNAATLFGSFEVMADAASTSGALASIMALFVGVLLIAGAVVMIALKMVVNVLFVVLAVFAPVVAVSLFTKRPDMLGRYLVKLVAVGLAPFMMTASLAIGASLVMSTIGGDGFAAVIPPPPTESAEPVDVIAELKKSSQAADAEGASAGLLVVSMISALGVMLVTIIAPAAPAALLEFTSDSTVISAGTAAAVAPVIVGGVAAKTAATAMRPSGAGAAGDRGGGVGGAAALAVAGGPVGKAAAVASMRSSSRSAGSAGSS